MKTKATYITAGLLALTSFAHGAITWGTPTNISSDSTTFESSVANNGTFTSAYNFGSTTAAVINGVTFQGVGATASVTNFYSITPSAGSTATTTATYADANGPLNALTDIDHRVLMRGFITGSTANGATQGYKLELQDLTPNQQYQIQIWVSDSRAFSSTALNLKSGILDSTISFDHNTTDNEGGLGQYVIGTFTTGATATTESFSYSGSTNNGTGFVPLNGFSLRAIPEPSSALLGSLGLCGLFLLRRR